MLRWHFSTNPADSARRLQRVSDGRRFRETDATKHVRSRCAHDLGDGMRAKSQRRGVLLHTQPVCGHCSEDSRCTRIRSWSGASWLGCECRVESIGPPRDGVSGERAWRRSVSPRRSSGRGAPDCRKGLLEPRSFGGLLYLDARSRCQSTREARCHSLSVHWAQFLGQVDVPTNVWTCRSCRSGRCRRVVSHCWPEGCREG
mmetsp:Transcript_46740/g.144158  ORF Transcript_46740/g.144158 Transcript_46740/m.144158 type:complete len:201 (+) Transcript_46740:141-743(+)